jgi:hypothetical protein
LRQIGKAVEWRQQNAPQSGKGRNTRMAMFNRLSRAVQAARDAAAGDAGSAAPVVAALVIGAGAGELAAARAWLRAAPNARAILITDQTAVELFQTPGVVTEFLPTGDWRTADPARKLYVQRRLVGILSKWGVARCAAIGPDAEQLIALVSARANAAVDMPALAITTPG